VFALLVKKAPRSCGVAALVLNPLIYGLLLIFFGTIPYFEKIGLTVYPIAFLNRMAITFVLIIIVMAIMTLLKPLDKPVDLPVRKNFDTSSSPLVKMLGFGVIGIVILLYIIFW